MSSPPMPADLAAARSLPHDVPRNGATSPAADPPTADHPDGYTWRDLTFKVADRPDEREQIHRLNHRTFADEIPQHAPHADARLVDKFDAENTYLVCLHGDRLIGMIALRGVRPFSLDGKLPDLDAYLPPHRAVCELRLLSIDATYRSGRVLLGLMGLIERHCRERGYDLGLISGTTRQQKLYRHLGFVPFGPLVGTGEARFQPMYLTLDRAETDAIPLLEPLASGQTMPAAPTPAPASQPMPTATPSRTVNLLPGPVAIDPSVTAAFVAEPISHRSQPFLTAYADVRRRLRQLVGAQHVALLHGSGTLANDAVAARLASLDQPGVILTNGEFGDRLVDAARRAGLAFTVVERPWGVRLGGADLTQALAASEAATRVGWAWLVHGETSTGVLNDLQGISAVATHHRLTLAVDAISTVGTIPVDLTGVALASGVSGKGLASYAGLAMVYADAPLDRPLPGATRCAPTPRYLDLAGYAGDAPPSTVPSNLVAALRVALERLSDPAPRFAAIARTAEALRVELGAQGFPLVAAAAEAAPAVLTVVLPPGCSAERLGDRLRDHGYLVSYQSGYLRSRNWLQLCLMGDHPATLTHAPTPDHLTTPTAGLPADHPLAPRAELPADLADLPRLMAELCRL